MEPPFGSFEVLWEAQEWRHSRVLYSKNKTGELPSPADVTRAVCKHLLGYGSEKTALLREQQPWLLRSLAALHRHFVGAEKHQRGQELDNRRCARASGPVPDIQASLR